MSNGSNKKVTATDVARLAGVSQSSVSRAFSKSSSVSKTKKARILEAAEKLGYQPNAFARGLTTNKSRIIGIVMRNVGNPFYPEVLEKFYNKLSERGYQLLFINSENNEIKEDEISQLIEYSVEGVIITDALLASSAVQRFLRNGISVVLFNRYIYFSGCSAVYCDNYSAAKKIGSYLLEKGHQKPAFISGPTNTSTTIDREKGFKEALFEGGIVTFPSEDGKYSYEGGFDAAIRLLKDNPAVDSIFCANDVSAFGAMDAIKKMGYRVPEDISIIGFDNVKTSGWASYELTTWLQPVDEMVEHSIKLLLEEENKSSDQPIMKGLQGSLVERNSVRDRNNG
ncbi:LacI family DNA-binding transcriptional regulator [Thalassorhabdus alkalitolerans]|uniref:LacI family DNA-binding transcriptional regulator n=1 Tax=Thalassorhabdus alkalitolerans TaxID=2282697 RepID=A0ABW0YNK0_9BACI